MSNGELQHYSYGTGRRKQASARVFLCAGSGAFTVNKKSLAEYFPRLRSQMVAKQSLKVVDGLGKYDLYVTVRGGGESGQAEAVRHGITWALVDENPEVKSILRRAGLVTRDSRAVERKKPGLRKARRARQYSKR